MFNLAKNYSCASSQLCFVFLCCFIVFGCQSRLDVAGGEHKVVTEKWMELSKYAESNLDDYDVTITARLAIKENKKFKLTHFKVNTLPTRQDINLLAPSFDNKYICSPLCFQLIEYVNGLGENGSTLLTNYFDRHEFELFKFYGDIQLLNKQITKLAKYDQRLLKSYLTSLAHQGASFELAKEFVQFLTAALTISAMENFKDNPEILFSHILKNNQIFTDTSKEQHKWTTNNKEVIDWVNDFQELNEWTDITTEQANWEDISKVSAEGNEWVNVSNEQVSWAMANKEKDGWLISTAVPELIWSNKGAQQPEALWLKDTILQNTSTDDINSSATSTPQENDLSWQTARTFPIKVGHNVCSYQESYFGVVVEILAEKVIVNLLGQAKVINEGVIYPADAGGLFTISDNLYFSPLTGKKSLNTSDVASCSLE